MNDETEQRQRVMEWARRKKTLEGPYVTTPYFSEVATVLLAQEEENTEQRTLLERLLRSRVWQGSDPLYLDLIAHLDGSKKAGWSEVLGILNDGSTPNGNTREQLAAYAHEAWSGWMEYLFSKCDKQKYELIIPAWAVERWGRQMHTPYADLSDKEKESDRAEADKMLAIINGSTPREEEDAAPPDDEPLTREVRHRVALMRDNTRLRQRVAELEQAITKPVENWLDNRAEVTRLREGLETVRKWLTQKGLSPDEYDMVMDFISNALAAKGAEDETGRRSTDEPHAINSSLCRDTCCDADSNDSSGNSPTPLKLKRAKETAIYPVQLAVNDNAERTEQWSAEIVAAIEEVRQEVKADRNCAINREQDQYSSLCKLMDKMQAQIVALREDLTGRIDMRCDERDEMQIQIDALTEAVLLLGTEVAIPKRKRETTIALGKLRKNGGE
jgi:hypothetical protein